MSDEPSDEAPSNEELVRLYARSDPVHWATDDRYRGVRRVWDSGYTRGFARGRASLQRELDDALRDERSACERANRLARELDEAKARIAELESGQVSPPPR